MNAPKITRTRMSLDRQRGNLLVAALTTGALGAAVVGGTLVVERVSLTGSDASPVAATPDYGQRLIRETAALLGPDLEDPERRYTGARIACASCHIDSGMKPGTLSLVETASRYPRFSGRDGGVGDLRDRINGCMQRSMNGRALPRDSVEMIAMETYILGLADRYAATAESRRLPTEQSAFVEPDRAADVEAGRIVFEERCEVCHGADGAGLMATTDPRDGYLFPPLWGPDSFNNGAGMHRVLTAARFIKARMPFGLADLTDDQAYDVAAYINSRPRPEMEGLERDYPDLARKPVDSPYPPYADPFPREQHRFGPFRPIREYYAQLEQSPSDASTDARQ
jgi:thiosulfate dehydrogenase